MLSVLPPQELAYRNKLRLVPLLSKICIFLDYTKNMQELQRTLLKILMGKLLGNIMEVSYSCKTTSNTNNTTYNKAAKRNGHAYVTVTFHRPNRWWNSVQVFAIIRLLKSNHFQNRCFKTLTSAWWGAAGKQKPQKPSFFSERYKQEPV